MAFVVVLVTIRCRACPVGSALPGSTAWLSGMGGHDLAAQLLSKLTSSHLLRTATCERSLESCSKVVEVELPALVGAREDSRYVEVAEEAPPQLEAVVEYSCGQAGRTWLGRTRLNHRPHSTAGAAD